MACIWTRRDKAGNPKAYVLQIKDEVTGNRRSEGTYHRKKDAERAKRELEEHIELGTHVPKRDACTFDFVAKKFLEHVYERERRTMQLVASGVLEPKAAQGRRKQTMSPGRRSNIEGVLENHLTRFSRGVGSIRSRGT